MGDTAAGHQDVITLAIGEHDVELTKIERLIGIRPRRGVDRGMVAELTGAGQANRLGDFEVVDVAAADKPMEEKLDELRESPAVEAGTHVFQTSDDGVPFVPTGEIYVEFAEAATPEQSTGLLAANRLEIVEPRGERAFLVQVTPDSPNPLKCAATLQASDLVEIAEPELATPAATAAFVLPTDPLIADQWHLRNTGRHHGTSVGFLAGADARVLDAWRRAESLGSPDVVVAVIDDGFDLGHPELSGPGKIVAPWDFRRGTDHPVPDPAAQDWHGTACAGVAVGNADGTGIVGVAPDCRLMPVRLGGALLGRNIEAWFDHVRTSGAWVVSCSWGALARFFPLPTLAQRAINRCAREGRDGRGAVVCFAAGNESRDIDGPGSLNGFAVHPDVLAVAACNSLDQPSDYSNFGAAIAVCAPSSGPPGWGIATADVRGRFTRPDGVQQAAGYSPGPYTQRFGGTSSACPLVAGVCALVLSVRPELTATEVREIVTGSARKIGGSNDDGHHPRFGFGCVNADAAVAAALGPIEAAEPALFRPPDLVEDFAGSTPPEGFARG